jgi:hypothetical protein
MYSYQHSKHISSIEQKLSEGQDVSWDELFSIPPKSLDFEEVRGVVENGIANELFYGKLKEWFSGEINGSEMRMLTTIANSTLKHFNKLTSDLGITNYNFVEITRTSISDLKTGTYVYTFSDTDDLIMLKVPYNLKRCLYHKKIKWSESTTLGWNRREIEDNFVIFDKQQLVKELRIIPKNMMKDFQYFGAQLMQTDVRMNTSAPGLGTVLAEFALGSSFAMMKGISNISLHSTHTIKDARVVQILLHDKTDIELKGISIYYELNRRMGNVKNKDSDGIENETKYATDTTNENSISNNESIKNVTSSTNLDYINELRQLKELLDEGILNQEEYDSKKKKILNL